MRGKSTGQAKITMDSSSAVLLNDGRGTQTELLFSVLDLTINPVSFIPIQVDSPSHPDEDAWYKESRVVIKFEQKSGQEYSYSFSSNLEIIPNEQSRQVPDEIVYEDMPDGVYFFKLNSRTASANWEEAGIFRVQIDSTPPEAFELVVASDPSIFGGQDFISFATVDKTSGISHFEAKVGSLGRSKKIQTPYKLSRPLVGDGVKIIAYDQAGNSREVLLEFSGVLSTTTFFVLLIIIFALSLAFIGKKRYKKLKLK